MEQIRIQLRRLEKHYKEALHTYDDVAILDLSHSLRIFTEIKDNLMENYPDVKQKAAFVSAIPINKMMKHISKCEYVMSYLPNEGVTTYASNGQLASRDSLAGHIKFSYATNLKINTDKSISLRQFCYVAKFLKPEDHNLIKQEKKSHNNFTNWMNSEIVRLQFKDNDQNLQKFTITREMLIKRVANCYDASHSSLNSDNKNRFDSAISHLMNYKCGGLPLPYFLLLKAAKDILEILPDLMINHK